MSVHAASDSRKSSSSSTTTTFLSLRKQIYTGLGECRDLCKLRHSVLLKSGNCFQSVKLGAEIRSALLKLHQEHKNLTQLYREENKDKRPWYMGVDEAFDDVELLGHLITHTEDAYNRNSSVEDIQELVNTISDIRVQQRREPTTRSLDLFSKRDLTGVEARALQRWNERESKLDKAIDMVGHQVENLGTVAKAVTQAVEEQVKASKPVEKNIQDAKGQMTDLSLKIRTVVAIEKKRGVCMCRTVLACILGGLIVSLFMILKTQFIDPMTHGPPHNPTHNATAVIEKDQMMYSNKTTPLGLRSGTHMLDGMTNFSSAVQ